METKKGPQRYLKDWWAFETFFRWNRDHVAKLKNNNENDIHVLQLSKLYNKNEWFEYKELSLE